MRVAALATLLVVYPAFAGASDRSDVLRARAERLADAGDCAAALPLAQRALDADPAEARAGRVAGRCLVELGRPAEAETVLLQTLERDPRLPGAQLQLAIARYHREDYAAARSALEAARATDAGGAEFELYDALLLLAEGERRAALDGLARAREASPTRVDPIASYYEGVGWASEGDRRKARAALERVVAADPDGPWGQQARAGLGEMRGGFRNDWWLEVTVGAERDDNVVLEGEDVIIPADIGDDDDERLVWDVTVGSELFRSDVWSGGAMLGYGGSAHRDLDEFDLHHPRATLWADRRIGESLTAHLQYDHSHVLVDDESFLVAHSATPALYYDWDSGGRSLLFTRLYWYDYRFPRRDTPPLDDLRNRDGHGIATGVEHRTPVESLSSRLRGGLTFDRYASRGGEYTHRRHSVHVASDTELPWELLLSLFGSWSYDPYSHSTTFPDPSAMGLLEGKTRRDRRFVFQADLERPLTEQLSASVSYRWIENDSNVDVFDYDRGILGAYLTFRVD